MICHLSFYPQATENLAEDTAWEYLFLITTITIMMTCFEMINYADSFNVLLWLFYLSKPKYWNIDPIVVL